MNHKKVAWPQILKIEKKKIDITHSILMRQVSKYIVKIMKKYITDHSGYEHAYFYLHENL